MFYLWTSMSRRERGACTLADSALMHIESSVHIGQEPERDPALYPAGDGPHMER